MNKVIDEQTVLSIKPVMGHLIVEVIDILYEDFTKKKLQDETGASQEFIDSLTLVEGYSNQAGMFVKKERGKAPVQCGRVVKMARSCFGQRFEHNYGKEDAEDLKQDCKIGSIVHFTPHQSRFLDPGGKYHLISEEYIQLIEPEREAQ